MSVCQQCFQEGHGPTCNGTGQSPAPTVKCTLTPDATGEAEQIGEGRLPAERIVSSGKVRRWYPPGLRSIEVVSANDYDALSRLLERAVNWLHLADCTCHKTNAIKCARCCGLEEVSRDVAAINSPVDNPKLPK